MRQPNPHTRGLTQRNIDAIAALFPNVVSETLNADDEPVLKIDFDALRQEISEHVIEGPQERYQLDWPGKRAAVFAANAPTAKTLRPVREESVDFDTTKNVFIEGDNLEALKLLQESYLGKVKLIYIDPPYNTGSDFLYKDDRTEDAESFLRRSAQLASTGERLVANPDANGRFHSDWLSMMYPRLKLARSLLADNGAIFVSIDDHERDNLKRLMDEIFGERAFVASVIWRKKASPDARSTIGAVHDYLLCYVRNAERPKDAIGKMALSEKRLASFSNPDNDPRGPWASVDMTGMTGRATKDQYFSITLPSGRAVQPPGGRSWGLVERTFIELRDDNRIWFGRDGDSVPRIKRFLSEAEGQTVPTYWDFADVGSNEEATDEVALLFGGVRVFDTPKPVRLMRRLLEIGTSTSGGDVVLDFFAGSGATGDAVLRANAHDGGNRRFILVQLDEPCRPTSAAAAAGYETIAAIARDRVRRVGGVLEGRLGQLDLGFRSLKVDTTSFADILRTPDELIQDSLVTLTGSILADRSDDDLLFQILIDWGLELSYYITREVVAGTDIYSVEKDALIACFADAVSDELVRAIAKRRPLRAVFKDSGFVSDAARINTEQIFGEVSPETEVRAI